MLSERTRVASESGPARVAAGVPEEEGQLGVWGPGEGGEAQPAVCPGARDSRMLWQRPE